MEELMSHWAFVATSLVLAFMGQAMKNRVFAKATIRRVQASSPNLGQLLWWGRKTLPIHPVFVGAMIGAMPGMPAPEEVSSYTARILYFALAGVMSTWGFSTMKSISKKMGIELEIPEDRDSTLPPEEPKS